MQPLFRPTFEITCDGRIDDVVARIEAAARDASLDTRRAGHHLMCSWPAAARHFWSPWLHIDVLPRDDGPLLRARFSPNPNIWTGLMLSYLTLGCTAVLTCGFGYALWALGKPASIAWIALACALVAVIILVASRIGQRLAGEQMEAMRAIVLGALAPTG